MSDYLPVIDKLHRLSVYNGLIKAKCINKIQTKNTNTEEYTRIYIYIYV